MLYDQRHDFLRSIDVIEQLVSVNRRTGIVVYDACQRTTGYKKHFDGMCDIGKQAGFDVAEQRRHREWHELQIRLTPAPVQLHCFFEVRNNRHLTQTVKARVWRARSHSCNLFITDQTLCSECS